MNIMEKKVYNAVLDEDSGITVLSLVDYPANESNWLCFEKQDKPMNFKRIDDEEHIIFGCIMEADKPIYRISPSGEEYYINFTKEVLKELSERMLRDKTFANVSLYHDGNVLPSNKANLVSIFTIDREKGIDPKDYQNLNNGSLMCSLKIHDEDLWELCKSDKLNGFSMEVYTRMEEQKFAQTKKQMTIIDKLKALLTEYSEVATEEGVILVSEGDLIEGTKVTNADGEPIEDGTYTVDNQKVEVKDSVVVSISEVEEEVTEEEEVKEELEEVEEEVTEEEVTEEETTVTVEELQAQIDELKKEIENLKEALQKPISEGIEESFSKVKTHKTISQLTREFCG